MNKLLSILFVFSFSLFPLHVFSFDESTECMDSAKKILIEGMLAGSATSKSAVSEQVEAYITDCAILIQVNVKLVNKDIRVTVKNVNSDSYIIDEIYTMDASNYMALPFVAEEGESYLIEMSQEGGYVYGYF